MNRTKQWCVQAFCLLLMPGASAGRAWAVDIASDFDHDCDVDSADLGRFRACALGAAIPQTDPACNDARLDADEDVDLDDFGIFQRCYSGAGLAADPNCDGTCVGPGCNCLCGQTDCNGACTWLCSDSAN